MGRCESVMVTSSSCHTVQGVRVGCTRHVCGIVWGVKVGLCEYETV